MKTYMVVLNKQGNACFRNEEECSTPLDVQARMYDLGLGFEVYAGYSNEGYWQAEMFARKLMNDLNTITIKDTL